MSNFSVKIPELLNNADELEQIASSVQNVAESSRRVISQTSSSIMAKVNAAGKGNVVISSIQYCSSDLRILSNCLSAVASKYRGCEQTVLTARKNPAKPQAVVPGNGATGLYDSEDYYSKKLDLIDNLKLCITNGVNLIAYYENAYNVIKNLKVPKGELATAWRKALFGLTDDAGEFMKIVKSGKNIVSGWGDAIKSFAKKRLDDAINGGIVLNAAFNFWSNCVERDSGQISSERAVAEFLTETAIDTAFDIVVGVGVGAVVSIVGAPAVAAGVATVAISITADQLTKTLTDGAYNSLTEYISDSILDNAGALIETASETCKSVRDAAVSCINNVKECLSVDWKKIFA